MGAERAYEAFTNDEVDEPEVKPEAAAPASKPAPAEAKVEQKPEEAPKSEEEVKPEESAPEVTQDSHHDETAGGDGNAQKTATSVDADDEVHVVGVEFLLRPDFSKMDSSVFLAAMGQSFYSLSIGMGCICTFASYFSRKANLMKSAVNIVVIDSLIAILAGLMIFPAAFSVGVNPDSGPSLIFITLPNVFKEAFATMPIIGTVIAIMFYVLLSLAALTSLISLHEVSTAFFYEELHTTRKKAATLVLISDDILAAIATMRHDLRTVTHRIQQIGNERFQIVSLELPAQRLEDEVLRVLLNGFSRGCYGLFVIIGRRLTMQSSYKLFAILLDTEQREQRADFRKSSL